MTEMIHIQFSLKKNWAEPPTATRAYISRKKSSRSLKRLPHAKSQTMQNTNSELLSKF